MTKVILLSSDFRRAFTLRCLLIMKGFTVTVCSTTKQARKLLQEARMNIMVVDIHRLDENAFAFVKDLRQQGIFLPVVYTGERSYQEVMAASCTGLDEYVARPMKWKTLESTLARALSKEAEQEKSLLYGDIKLDEVRQILKVKDKFVNLGKLEMKILTLLVRKAGSVVGLELIHKIVEKEGARFNTRIFFHISCLRKKMEEAGIKSLQINFVKDGYRLDVI